MHTQTFYTRVNAQVLCNDIAHWDLTVM